MSGKGEIVLIAAMSLNRIIGRDNELPWHLPGDLKHFRALTKGKPVIMGRKTFDSIGRPLPKRTNIVITRNPDFAHEGVFTAATPEEALSLANEAREDADIMVIGGAQIYMQMLPLANRVELTLVDIEIEGDAEFPAMSPAEWTLESETDGADATQTEPSYRFQRFRRS